MTGREGLREPNGSYSTEGLTLTGCRCILVRIQHRERSYAHHADRRAGSRTSLLTCGY